MRAHGTQAYEGERYRGKLRSLLRLQTTQGALYGGSRVANGALNSFLLAAVIALGGSLVASGALPPQKMTQ